MRQHLFEGSLCKRYNSYGSSRFQYGSRRRSCMAIHRGHIHSTRKIDWYRYCFQHKVTHSTMSQTHNVSTVFTKVGPSWLEKQRTTAENIAVPDISGAITSTRYTVRRRILPTVALPLALVRLVLWEKGLQQRTSLVLWNSPTRGKLNPVGQQESTVCAGYATSQSLAGTNQSQPPHRVERVCLFWISNETQQIQSSSPPFCWSSPRGWFVGLYRSSQDTVYEMTGRLRSNTDSVPKRIEREINRHKTVGTESLDSAPTKRPSPVAGPRGSRWPRVFCHLATFTADATKPAERKMATRCTSTAGSIEQAARRRRARPATFTHTVCR